MNDADTGIPVVTESPSVSERPTAPPTPVRDPSKDPALIKASYRNNLAVAARLIAGGASVNVKDDSQQSAFLISTSEVGDDPRLLNLTLRNGADVNAKDRFNGTGLIRAADRGFPTIAAHLLQAGISRNHINRLGWTALHEAIILGDGSARYVQTVNVLVRGGVNVNIPSRRDGLTPLAHAENRGYTKIAAILRAAGATY